MNRYSRQLLYKNIGEEGQKMLVDSTVAVVGVGALGSVCAELLARAGLNLILIDRDFIEMNNLQRQTLFVEGDVGKAKALVAKEKLKDINSTIKIKEFVSDLNYKNVRLLKTADIILGCTDNMESRFLINDYSLKNNIPWIYGGAVADRGFLFNIMPGNVCFRCMFKGQTTDTCDTIGILNTNSSVVASLMANEAIKIILGNEYEKDLLHINVWKNRFEKIKVNKDGECPACDGNYEYLSGKQMSKTVKMCGRDSYQIKGRKVNLDELENKLKKQGKVISFESVIHFKNLSVFEDGRVLVKAQSKEKAQALYSKYIGN